jgi:hypothetical protein
METEKAAVVIDPLPVHQWEITVLLSSGNSIYWRTDQGVSFDDAVQAAILYREGARLQDPDAKILEIINVDPRPRR